jgi:hypothetical protein
MVPQRKYKIIASLLLLVFSINTIAGFACSIGVDMGYNTHHHQGADHPREYGSDETNTDGVAHHKHAHHHNNDKKTSAGTNCGSTDDNCCAGDVTKFIQLDKSVAHNNLELQTPVFFLTFTASFSVHAKSESGATINANFPFVRRSCFLNDTDIKIAIQSLQI